MSQSSSSRPLAPAPPDYPRQNPSPLSVTVKDKKVSMACGPCKKFKRKCTGMPPPCQACTAHADECIFDASTDKRRKVATRRQIAELETYQDSLLYLVEALQVPDLADVERLITWVRSQESPEEVAEALRIQAQQRRQQRSVTGSASVDGESDRQSPAAPPARPKSPAERHKQLMSISVLTDAPMFNVPASPWTAITDNDNFVSHLVSLYFTWIHQPFFVVGPSPFIEAMQQRDVKSEICSPFLVNMMLALACKLSDFPQARAVPDSLDSRGLQFFSEAQRLWEEQRGRASLANAQGLNLMMLWSFLEGQDRVGWLLNKQAIQMMRDIGLARGSPWMSPDLGRLNEESAAAARRARGLAAHAVFASNCMISLALMRPADFNRPLQPWTMSEEEMLRNPSQWRAYPGRSEFLDSWDYLYLHELCQLSEICVELQDILFGKHDLDRSKAIVMVESNRSRLRAWYEHVSPLLARSGLVPGATFLELSYHMSLMTLFGSCRYPQNVGLPPNLSQIAGETCVSSARAIASALRAHCEQHGTRLLPPLITLATQAALFVLIIDLDSPESADAFVTCCQVLELLGRNWKLPRALLRMAWLTTSHLCITPPPLAMSILREFASESRITAKECQEMSIGLPNLALLLAEEPSSVATACLSDLFEEWQSSGPSS